MIIRNIVLCSIICMLLSGCGVVGAVVNTSGTVIGAGFAAAVPNQGSDDDDF